MAGDQTLKTVLLKIGVDLSQFTQAADRIRGTLNDLSKIGTGTGTGGGSGTSAVQKQIDAVRDLQAATKAAAQTDIAAAKQAFEEKKALINQEYAAVRQSYQSRKSSAADYTSSAKKLNSELYEAEKAFAQSRYEAEAKMAGTTASKAVEAEKLKQAEIRRTTELMRAQYGSQAREGRMTALPRQNQGVFGRMTSGFMSGGFSGAIGGIAAGGLLLEGAESLFEKFKELGEAMRENAEIAAEEVQLYQTMKSVAGARIGDEHEYVDALRDSSEHLVDDAALIRTATAAFRNNSEMTAGQLQQLVKDVTKLGMASYGAAGATKAIEALNTFFTSGRGYALAYSLQLTQLERQMLSSQRTTTSSAAAMQQFNNAIAIIHQEAQKTAEPIITVAVAEEQYAVASEQLKHEILALMETSPGLIAVWQALADAAIKALDGMSTARDKWASVIDDFTKVIAESAITIANIVAFVAPLVASALQVIPNVGVGIHQRASDKLQGQQKYWGSTLNYLWGGKADPTAMWGIQQELKNQGVSVPDKAMNQAQLVQAVKGYIAQLETQKESELALAQESEDTATAIGNLGKDARDAANGLAGLMAARISAPRTAAPPFRGAGGTQTLPLTPQEQSQVAEQEAKNRDTARQTELDKQKAIDEQELQALQDSLRQGEVSEQEYHDKVAALQTDLYHITVAQNASRAKAQIETQKASLEDPRLSAPKIKSARLEQQKADVEAYANWQKQLQELNEQTTNEQRQEALKRSESNRDLTDKDLEDQQKKNTIQYQSGKETTNDYYSKQRAIYQQQVKAYQASTAEILKMAGMTAEERVAMEQAMAEKIKQIEDEISSSILEQQKAIQAEQLRTAGENVQGAQKTYESARQVLVGRGIEQQPVQNIMLKQQIQSVVDAYQQQEAAIKAQMAQIVEGTPQWEQLNEQLQSVEKSMTQFQESLDELQKTIQGQLLGAFQLIIAAISGKLGAGGGAAAGIAGVAQGASTLANAGANIYSSYKQLLKPTSVTGAMQSGGQLGSTIGSFFGPMGSMIGGAMGDIVGVVRGIFTEAARHIAEEMTRAFGLIQLSLQTAQINLGQAITQMEATYQQFVAEESGQKGGQAQIAEYGPQMQEEIASLKAQQAQILESFGEGAAVGSLPVVIQDIGQQVEQLITNYQQYIDAGGSVQTANQSLSESFTALGQSIATELNQDYTNAIQNALNYNNLLEQRLQLEYDTAQQEQSILSQGVLTRSTTQAQSEMYQIEQLQRNKTLQEQQLDPQIAAAQAQLQAQEQIFNLAQTRVGLEQQLVQAQQYTINLDMQRITLLQAMMQEISAGAGPLPSFASSIASVIAQTELNQGGVVTSQTAINALLAAWGITASTATASTATTPASAASSPSAASQALEDIFNSYYQLQGRYGTQSLGAQI